MKLATHRKTSKSSRASRSRW